MTTPSSKLNLTDVSAAKTRALDATIQGKVNEASGGSVAAVLAIKPTASRRRLGRLFALLTSDEGQGRRAVLLEIMDELRKELPVVLKNSPLRLSHFGFKQLEDFVKYLVSGLEDMQTRAESFPEFKRGVKGWRWNFAGRLLFERLVKYHPGLDEFFRKLAGHFFSMLNSEIRKRPVMMVNGVGTETIVGSPFGTPRKVLEFRLVGADGVERAYTDFGFIASNQQGLWAGMLVEIKMPAALRAVAAQFAEFLPRLKEAKRVVAIIEGEAAPALIDPAKFVFLHHDRAQVAVAPLPERQILEAFKPGDLTPVQVAKVERLDLATSGRNDLIYYKVQVLVLRDWLVDIVRIITDS